MLKNLLFILTFLLNIHLNGAEIHAILVQNNYGDEGFENNIDLMTREVKKIAALTGLDLEITLFEDFYTSRKKLLKHLEALTVAPDDIIIYYSVLHGSRELDKENRWPNLHFLDGSLDFKLIQDILKAKNPQFLLALTDSCNSSGDDYDDEEDESNQEEFERFLEQFGMPQTQYFDQDKLSMIRNTKEDYEIDAYCKLFLQNKGSLIISTSSPGETSTKHNLLGGFYTIAFIHSLKSLSQEQLFPDPSFNWESVLNQSAIELEEFNKIFWGRHDIEFSQTPQYEMN